MDSLNRPVIRGGDYHGYHQGVAEITRRPRPNEMARLRREAQKFSESCDISSICEYLLFGETEEKL
jgi:hypothetical protein